MRHDDRRGAGDWDEADLEGFFLGSSGLGECLACQREREELADGGERRGGADQLQKRAPGAVLAEEGADDRRGDDALYPCRIRAPVIVLRLAPRGRSRGACAVAAFSLERTIGIEGIIEGHRLCLFASALRRAPNVAGQRRKPTS